MRSSKNSVEHVTTAPYNHRSKGQAERFVDTFKQALKMSDKEVTDEVALQQFLRVYHMAPNPNTPARMSPAELMFVRKVISVFEKLLSGKKRKFAMENTARIFKIGEKVFVRAYKNIKKSWEDSVTTKRIGKVLYLVNSRKGVYKRHMNQPKKRFVESEPKKMEEPMEWLYYTFQAPTPLWEIEPRPTSIRKRKMHGVPESGSQTEKILNV
ncbi:uncharacterized protein K02A2.6-like [Octopus bimaculoides]|uniref:uncharacterized protein K02A2.6-like n=1 Tax=Octopus bimaculoides TaxID=37653 RepID=UPI00071E3BBB|nr:uncharacterized protein K02A2.6-like [Octopus bimaculoides]|eukprot:XP_014775262.1 PREDICTED: uncharacterized protein K02A2.6-like [Octopus bimaculoides]